jgi:DNA-binding transcriptional ArsR family regulator
MGEDCWVRPQVNASQPYGNLTFHRGNFSFHSIMRPTYTIEDIFSTPARARVLRALANAGRPLSVRDVAKWAGISHTAASRVLKELDAIGLVSFTPVGRSSAYSLERRNTYVKHMVLPAIDAEETIANELSADLVNTFAGSALSLVLFGSYAYGEPNECSDIDVFALAEDERRKQQLDEAAWKSLDLYWAKYGATLSLISHTTAEFADPAYSPSSAFRIELASTGIILHGLGPGEWRRYEPEDQDEVDPSGRCAPLPHKGHGVRRVGKG